jgi:nucleoside-diphosphate-sugar epimerase
LKIVVTGGTGFIASNLIPKLQKAGHEVYNIERYVTGRHVGNKLCSTFFADLRDGFAVRKILHDVNPEVIFHIAAISAVSYSYEHPQEVIESNLIGTINLAEAALREANSLKQFLFAGTSEEYGNNGHEIQVETNPLLPASPYAVSKVAGEKYLNYMKAAYDFPITLLRPFNTYGRTNDAHFLIERAITQMLTKKSVNLIDPTPIRDWMYVDDHVSAYLACLGNKKALGETFNFSTGKGHSVKETVDIISRLVNFNGEIVWGAAPKRPTESKAIIGNSEKAKKVLGWSPRYTLEEGLKETINYWRKKLQ